ncbi:hypothetical protein [Acidithiobacillus caldus]|uniref:hypothetical protein n=1 Tax=Acidithiobacillus caldus TaxID=33059 RepID=UPI001C06EFE6|nr:hypothetical protein [Acidithiobacillus caldus]MDD3761125.1 hypothetical protein [Acidithiobacillus sp.]
MSRRKQPSQPDLLADISSLSQFPRRKPRHPAKFDGPRNPREARALRVLLKTYLTREALDEVAGASNGPEIVNQLRSRGLELPCYRLGTMDRDGVWVYRGLYALSYGDRRQVARALSGGDGGAGNATKGTARETEAKSKKGGRRYAE